MQENPAWATSPALSRLVRTQTAWLRNHLRCGYDEECLLRSYQARLKWLYQFQSCDGPEDDPAGAAS
jgi:uncharacterized protein